MARLPRLAIAGYPHHVLQRGHNRQPIFLDLADREFFLRLLRSVAPRFGVAVHAYVLMDDHFHLLATPQTAPALSAMMQAIGRSYARYFNDGHARSGSLWDGRYRATVLQASDHLLSCMVYLDLNPVRHGLTPAALDYPWSSYRHYAGIRVDPVIAAPDAIWQLGNTTFARESAYRERVEQGLAAVDVEAFTRSVLHGWALGDNEFVAELQRLTSRRLSPAARGRPANKR
ncbi:MAG: transposase [Burkholderiaceae bacterium]